MSPARTSSLRRSKASLLKSSHPDKIDQFLNSLSPEELKFLEWDWSFWGRPDQQLPTNKQPNGDDWFVWVILSGRGWGKTRTAVENISALLRGPSPMIAPPGAPELMTIIADTPFDMRQYTIEGPSGFLNVGPPNFRPMHSSSNRTLTWPNGCRALLFSAEDPETLRGASGSLFWWDELAKARYAREGWNNMMFGMREGKPRGLVTTTPKPIPLLREILARPSTFVTRGSTWDNQDNLAPEFYKNVIEPLEGTRLGRQEIEGEIIDDVQGALWTRAMIDYARLPTQVPDFQRVVIAIDPSGTRGEDANGNNFADNDLIGMVAAARGVDGHCYVLEDYSCDLSPAHWGLRAVHAFRTHAADRVIAEANFGGAMVEHVIKTTDRTVPYKEVKASRGKVARAEPVSALYEQGKVHHLKSMTRLEDQMCLMTNEGYEGEGSPDRVDALVWAVTELMLDFKPRTVFSSAQVTQLGARR